MTLTAETVDKNTETEEKEQLLGAPLEEYALIGDCETAALVCREGSVDWLCWPTFSSNACFAGLLGTRENGYFSLKPAASEQLQGDEWRYKPHTLIVEKVWKTANGEVLVSDFMPPRGRNSDVVRIVRGLRGEVAMRMDLMLRFDYGRTIPWVERVDHHQRAVSGPHKVVLRQEAPLNGEGMSTVSDFTVHEGESICFQLSYGSSTEEDPDSFDAYDAYNDTERFWTEWADRSTHRGQYQQAVERSLITLKALTYRPTGGLVAAPTMSLPEKAGGERNWDYRFCWLRDTAFTLLVLLYVGYVEEARAWRGWLLRSVSGSAEQLQSLYGLAGERMNNEWQADWLAGYKHSQPVSIGNKAASQVQLDVFGEVISALVRTPVEEDDQWTPAVFGMVHNLLDRLTIIWKEPDSGIWETRGPAQHFVHSKVMAWVAFDRAIRAYEDRNDTSDSDLEQRVEGWRKTRSAIHEDVCERGFNKERNSFVQAYGSNHVDAALLRLPLVGFLRADDPRVQGTVAAVEKDLMRDGLLLRYDTEKNPDGLPPGEGAFLACSFWHVAVLYLSGRKDEAHTLFQKLLALRNPLGLISEEYNVEDKCQIGNYPQALTHLAMVHAAIILEGGKGPWSEAMTTDAHC